VECKPSLLKVEERETLWRLSQSYGGVLLARRLIFTLTHEFLPLKVRQYDLSDPKDTSNLGSKLVITTNDYSL
jgi:hypothetical protein